MFLMDSMVKKLIGARVLFVVDGFVGAHVACCLFQQADQTRDLPCFSNDAVLTSHPHTMMNGAFEFINTAWLGPHLPLLSRHHPGH